MKSRLTLALSAAAVASVLLLAGCSGPAESTGDSTAAPSDTSKPSETSEPAEEPVEEPAASDQTVEEACTFAEESMGAAIAGYTPIPESLAAGNYAEASDNMNAILAELNTIESEIGNSEVQAAFGVLVGGFETFAPILNDMKANAADPVKIAELQDAYKAAGSAGDTYTAQLGALCPSN